jgi:hypothetical protein
VWLLGILSGMVYLGAHYLTGVVAVVILSTIVVLIVAAIRAG